jgi:hypothetical protein
MCLGAWDSLLPTALSSRTSGTISMRSTFPIAVRRVDPLTTSFSAAKSRESCCFARRHPLVGSQRLYVSDLEAARESSTLVMVLVLYPPHSATAAHDGDFVVVVVHGSPMSRNEGFFCSSLGMMNAWSSVCCSREAASFERLQLCCCLLLFCCQCHASSKACAEKIASLCLNARRQCCVYIRFGSIVALSSFLLDLLVVGLIINYIFDFEVIFRAEGAPGLFCYSQ